MAHDWLGTSLDYQHISTYTHIVQVKAGENAMSNVRWSIIVPEETDRALRSFLARKGTKKGDISRFVEEAVQFRLFDLTVDDIKERNRPFDQNEILEAIEEALADK